MKLLRWWIGAVVMFVLMIDTALVLMPAPSISMAVYDRFQIDIAPAMFCFVAGGLFVHFTGWYPKERGE